MILTFLSLIYLHIVSYKITSYLEVTVDFAENTRLGPKLGLGPLRDLASLGQSILRNVKKPLNNKQQQQQQQQQQLWFFQNYRLFRPKWKKVAKGESRFMRLVRRGNF